jgi:hypothetical protein
MRFPRAGIFTEGWSHVGYFQWLVVRVQSCGGLVCGVLHYMSLVFGSVNNSSPRGRSCVPYPLQTFLPIFKKVDERKLHLIDICTIPNERKAHKKALVQRLKSSLYIISFRQILSRSRSKVFQNFFTI